jgi:DUF177 domain-containing protein
MLRVDLARLGREGPLRIKGVVEAAGFVEDDAPFSFVGDPEVDIRVASAGSGEVIVRGTVRGRISRECRRCLIQVTQELDTEVTMVFSPSDDLEEDDGEIRLIDPSEIEIDLGPPLREELILSVPPYGECRQDCRGLCPHCGVNLNDEECDCGGAEPDSRWDALRALQDE